MKKIFLVSILILFNVFLVTAQTNVTIPVNENIYEFLDVAQKKGYCSSLNAYKPYTKLQIYNYLQEIYDNSEKMSEKEIQIVEEYITKYDPYYKDNSFKLWEVNYHSNNGIIPVSFNYKSAIEGIYSGGLYSDPKYNSWGMDNIYKLRFDGDFGTNISYVIQGVIDFSKMPLMEIQNYFIGYPWYDENVENFLKGRENPSSQNGEYDISEKERYIRRYLNNSYLPYSYKKIWYGQFYFFNNMNAAGLEGWASDYGFGFSIDGDLRASFLDNHVILGMGRFDREIAAMDNGSSLVLNSQAYPFLAMDVQFKLFDFLKYYSLTGILEYPNQDYINEEELRKMGYPGNIDDAYYYQNAFSLNMIEIDYKRLHMDFGCSVIWPKRFELGYIFPLANYVEYQNHIGDLDNLALFGDIKYTIADFGSIWGSVYLDEINGLNNNPFNSTRAMYAYQAGAKYVLPNIPFSTVSFRYTKIEPYCYTHLSINHAPWYQQYICENYSNNGESLGYYLPPNSDEFLLSVKFLPASNINAGVSYQLIRHGADYGSQQVPGSNIYSELSPYNRDELKKYFLHDGAYNWIHILSTGGKIVTKTKIPVSLYGNIGFMFSYFTTINADDYDRSIYGNNGNCKNINFKTPFDIANTEEYPTLFGAVLTLGFNINY